MRKVRVGIFCRTARFVPPEAAPVRFLVAIPVFNEQKHLPQVLDAVGRYASDVLVVDDGSTDGTGDILRRRGRLTVLTHPTNRGYGRSLIDAFGLAAAAGHDWMLSIDCDNQHEASQIPDFLAEARRGRADVISGSRYRSPRRDDDVAPPDRRRINACITWILNETLGLSLTDAFCGFKAYRVAALAGLSLDVDGYAFPLQFWVQAALAGLSIRELPVRRLYPDPNRHFGGALDDPDARLRHYLDVFDRELRRVGWSRARRPAARA